MGGIISNIFFPIKVIYVKLFEINRFIATTLLASLTTFFLFVLMVTLTSLGETALKEDKSVKLADIVMPERDIETFTEEIEKPDEPEQKPEDIAQPEVDLQPVAGIEVSIAKPTMKFETSGTFFRDGEHVPLFKITPIYPRRALETGTQGMATVSFTITEAGSIENVEFINGFCTRKNPKDPTAELRACKTFKSSSERAALKLKYKPKIVDGKPVRVDGVQHRFVYELAED